jgi:hypothetical protein
MESTVLSRYRHHVPHAKHTARSIQYQWQLQLGSWICIPASIGTDASNSTIGNRQALLRDHSELRFEHH